MLTGNTCKYSIAGSVIEEGVASTLYAGSLKHSGLSTCVMVIRMSASAHYGCFVVILLSVKDLQHIDSAIPGRYTVQVPYKAGAGIGVLELHTATIGALASFLLLQLSYTQIMVGWVGAPKGAPVSVCAGYANPAQFTTSEIGVSGGGSYPLHTEAAIMATVPTSPYLKIEVVNGQAVTTSLSEYLKLLRLAGVPGYISRVAVNPATGIGVPEYTEEHNRAHAVFSCYAHCHTQIMVGRAGASKDAPGSSVTGYANPVRLTTSVIGVPCGELKKLTEGGVK